MQANDHRVIGNRMELFHQQEEGAGMVFWHPRGWTLYRLVEEHLRRRMRRLGFREIRTPQLLSRGLWEASGHWDKFRAAMFTFEEEGEGRAWALKPMSCPGHIQVFNRRLRSFRELPLRLFEFGAVHRNEPSGGLLGLARTRAFVQDDSHVFCRPDQVVAEVARFAAALGALYGDFGFDRVEVGLSTRPAERAGDERLWDIAEAQLAEAAQAARLDYRLQPGEGAFYGPKLEFHLRDSRGRSWQCGTVQLDLVLPERLEAAYIDAEGRRCRPVILHQAVLGSLERFLALLLEHHGGRLPLWLAPEQVLVASVSEAAAPHACAVAEAFEEAGLRVALDEGSDRLGRKAQEARRLAIPVLAVVGAREAERGEVSLRWPEGEQETLPLPAALRALTERARPPG